MGAEDPDPKSLLYKLGVKARIRVLVLGVEDESFLSDLRGRTAEVVLGEGSSSARPTTASGRAGRGFVGKGNGAGYDAVFVAVDEPKDMDELPGLKRAIKPNGAVWAVFRKGRKDFNENEVLRGGLAAGLVDVRLFASPIRTRRASS